MDKTKHDEPEEFTDSVMKTKRSAKKGWKMSFLKLHGDRFLFFKIYVKIGEYVCLYCILYTIAVCAYSCVYQGFQTKPAAGAMCSPPPVTFSDICCV